MSVITDKVVSLKSLQNLQQSNQEAKAITKEAIETALLLLLEDKPLQAISISELVSKAGVSRNAFYRHYKSKEHIFETILTRVVRRIFRVIKPFNLKSECYQAWLALLTEAKKEAKVLRLIFTRHFENLLTHLISKRVRAYQKYKSKQSSTYANSFWSSAIVSVLSNWVADDMQVPEEELAAMGLPLLSGGI